MDCGYRGGAPLGRNLRHRSDASGSGECCRSQASCPPRGHQLWRAQNFRESRYCRPTIPRPPKRFTEIGEKCLSHADNRPHCSLIIRSAGPAELNYPPDFQSPRDAKRLWKTYRCVIVGGRGDRVAATRELSNGAGRLPSAGCCQRPDSLMVSLSHFFPSFSDCIDKRCAFCGVNNRLPSWRQFADNGANRRGSKVIGGRIHDAKFTAWMAARFLRYPCRRSRGHHRRRFRARRTPPLTTDH